MVIGEEAFVNELELYTLVTGSVFQDYSCGFLLGYAEGRRASFEDTGFMPRYAFEIVPKSVRMVQAKLRDASRYWSADDICGIDLTSHTRLHNSNINSFLGKDMES